MTDHRRALGRLGEQLALAHLERLGFRALARNHRTRRGEIDLIVFDGTTIAFVEVKTRRAGQVSPFASIGARKQSRVRALAADWLRETPRRPRAGELRFDAIAVMLDRDDRLAGLEHLEGAY